ncbi:hypothetical protein OIU84_010156 [Salix udensis]|uniref:F-box domain-containing protein n=1 Tax=Salix udensis TaxID=889485 RepID=A0AAD6NVS2_9ROSI|nr:hypothetical protein OIU84_010156 [Salix udensis]
MKEGISENEGETEGNFGNNEEDTEATALRDLRQERYGQESMRWTDEMNRAMQRARSGFGGDGGGATNWGEMGPGFEEEGQFVAPPLALRRSAFCTSWLGRGENSGSSSAVAEAAGSCNEGCDRDAHNKRARVNSCSNDCHYAAVMASGAGNSTPSADRHLGLRDDGDDSITSKSEDLEVRMDLTDDLLHMVFSFLDHVNLCQAAKVCRQWRAASSHEDFWRCLNFENRNISVEQCEFDLVPSAKSFTQSSSCIWVEYRISVKRCGFEKLKELVTILSSLSIPLNRITRRL